MTTLYKMMAVLSALDLKNICTYEAFQSVVTKTSNDQQMTVNHQQTTINHQLTTTNHQIGLFLIPII